jgi:hypothetical protein
MTTSRYRARLGILVVIIALGFALWQERRLTRATAALAASVEEQTVLLHELDVLAPRARARAVEWEQSRRGVNTIVDRTAVAATPTAAARLSAEDAHAAGAIRATMDLRYRAALERLGVPADAIARWEDAAIGYDQRMRDIAAAAREQHLPMNDPVIAELRRAETARMAADSTALIGPNAQAAVSRLSALTPVTNLVEQLAGMVFASESPLTPSQGEQLTDLIAKASPAFRQGHHVVLGAIDWNTVLTQTQPVLSPTQTQALREILSDLRTRSDLSQRIAALRHP